MLGWYCSICTLGFHIPQVPKTQCPGNVKSVCPWENQFLLSSCNQFLSFAQHGDRDFSAEDEETAIWKGGRGARLEFRWWSYSSFQILVCQPSQTLESGAALCSFIYIWIFVRQLHKVAGTTWFGSGDNGPRRHQSHPKSKSEVWNYELK